MKKGKARRRKAKEGEKEEIKETRREKKERLMFSRGRPVRGE